MFALFGGLFEGLYLFEGKEFGGVGVGAVCHVMFAKIV